MITYPLLNDARLGNQLFGMAATLAHAARSGCPARFPPWKSAPYFSMPPEMFGEIPPDTQCYDQPSLTYDIIDAHVPGAIYALRGNFISYKFFAGYDRVVRRAFAPAIPRERNDFIAVHVRRGDYVGGPYVQLGLDWYERQMAEFTGARFLVFSDDIPECRRMFGHREDVDYAIDYGIGSAEEDLITMSLCAGHIVANSTFSWWGAWLSGKDNVIAPRHYHTEAFRSRAPNIQQWEDRDLWPPSWRLVDT